MQLRLQVGTNIVELTQRIRRRKHALLILGLLFVFGLPTPTNSQSDSLPRADKVVTPRAYVSLAPVPRARTFEIAVVGEILPGFHVNSNPASQDYLIPTQLTATFPSGFRILSTSYPPGVLRKFKFSPVQLSVYEGKFTVRLRLAAENDAPLGAQKIPLILRYQACNDEACLPPVKLPLTADVAVSATGTIGRAMHAEIFSPRKHVRK